MHKKLSLALTLGLIGNALFILFALLAYTYYRVYDPDSKSVVILEHITYTSLMSGFFCLAASALLLWITLRMRTVLKAGFSIYIIMEAVLMYLELNSFRYMSFYEPYSLKLAIAHSILSAAVCFLFVYLDPYKMPFEIMIILCIGLILGGMFGNIMGIRIYFSILVNAISFAILFFGIKVMIKREIIEIDCYGDIARVAEYRSVFFEEDADEEDEPADTGDNKAPEAETDSKTEESNVSDENTEKASIKTESGKPQKTDNNKTKKTKKSK